MKPLPRVEYTAEARSDFNRCRQFLRHRSSATAWRRVREIVGAVRRIRENPESRLVRTIDPDTGLPLRRCNVAQFVIVYVYYKPSNLEPKGLVSLRAFRHASEEDVFWEMREPTLADALIPARTFLSTRTRQPSAPWQPLTTYGEITFTPNAEVFDVDESHARSP